MTEKEYEPKGMVIPSWPTLVYLGKIDQKEDIESLMDPFMNKDYEDKVLSRMWQRCNCQSSLEYQNNNPDKRPYPWIKIKEYIDLSIQDYFIQLGGRQDLKWQFTDMWLNKYDHGEWQEPHRHVCPLEYGPDCCFSFNYMLKKPSRGENLGGEIIFERESHSYHEDRLSNHFEAYAYPNQLMVSPEEGEIVIFHDSLKHWVRPNQSVEESRYTISGNVIILPPDKKGPMA